MATNNRINYITNLDTGNHSGGWSAMNHHVYSELSKDFSINLIQNINPKVKFSSRVVSKVKCMVGLPAQFTAFSYSRLSEISRLVSRSVEKKANFDFFHGATPWVRCELQRPYGMYLDGCFATYIEVYHEKEKFSGKQLKTIMDWEGEFLEKASVVFFSSRWALEQAKSAYRLSGQNFIVAGLGGNITIPERGALKRKKKYLLFVGLDFFGKGGVIVAEAFKAIRRKFPDFCLYLVGGKPSEEILQQPGVRYFGRLNKTDPNQLREFQQLFAEAFLLVLPTNRDITPLVIIEAGYYGCPSVAVNNFGIPELIVDKVTGMLVHSRPTADKLSEVIERLCYDEQYHDQMCENVYRHCVENFTWSSVGSVIRKNISRFLL